MYNSKTIYMGAGLLTIKISFWLNI